MTAPASRSLRVLLVDDHVDSSEFVALALSQAGHIVESVESGVHALERLAATSFDVALIDISLPDIDGLEVARRACALLGARVPRLIALTGHGRETDRAASHAAGFSKHLVKPVELETLLCAVAGEPLSPRS